MHTQFKEDVSRNDREAHKQCGHLDKMLGRDRSVPERGLRTDQQPKSGSTIIKTIFPTSIALFHNEPGFYEGKLPKVYLLRTVMLIHAYRYILQRNVTEPILQTKSS